MSLKDWWNKSKYWKRGMLIGFFFGIIKGPLFANLGEFLPEFIGNLFFKVPDEVLCSLFNINDGEPCGFFSFIYGFIYNPIFYGIIGILLASIYKKIIKTHGDTK